MPVSWRASVHESYTGTYFHPWAQGELLQDLYLKWGPHKLPLR